MQSAAAGWDAAYHDMPAGRLPSAEESARAVAAVAPPVVGAGSSSSAGAAEVPLSQARLGGVMLHRQSGEGLTATGFEPARHSVVILGRPVQASSPGVASDDCHGCFCFCSFSSTHPRRPLPFFLVLLRSMLCSCSLTQGYPFTPAAARRAFRRVPSRRKL